jgi:hypothetical protein
MRVNTGIIIILSLLFLAGTVMAVGIPDAVTITSDKSYVVAGSGEQATITAIVSNISTASPVSGATVEFKVIDSVYGSFTPLTATTDASGRATSYFKVSTKSGIATINGVVPITGATSTIMQKIDHNKAYKAIFSHPLEGEVNTTVPFTISFSDYYGNPIDQLINTNQTHTVSLHVYGPSPNDCFFVGYGHEILTQVVDPNGNVSVQVKLTSAAGPNSVTMDQFELIPPPSQRIITAISSDVSSMKSTINPLSPPGVPADGISQFMITYILYDQYRNPAGQKELWVNTSLIESTMFKTDNLGQIVIMYGKKITPGTVTINATAIANPFVNVSDTVEFTSTTATTIVLSANPEVMVSRDKVDTAKSNITAKITNIMGGASPGETVTFSLGTDTYPGGPFNVTNRSSFSRTSVVTTMTEVTDGNGDATVEFVPGSFSTKKTDLHYSDAATGQVTVTATWIDSSPSPVTHTKDIVVKWKNYPYLSAKTILTPDTIKVNETVDVSILLTADGWALQPVPIDVVLVMDRSGSMNDALAPDTKLDNAKRAAKIFVGQMSPSRDRIGVVSYAGYTAGTGTRTDITLTKTYTNVNTTIDSLNANGATETREAIKQSIDLIKANPNSDPKAVQAIILMTDGNYNWLGNPLGRGTGYASPYNTFSTNAIEPNKYRYYSGLGCTLSGGSCNDGEFTEQNLSIYAKNNNIRLYMIGFAATLDPQAVSDMTVMANSTGGFYQYAPDAAALNQIYTKIAGQLKDTASVDTAMSADFTNVNVTGVSVPGADVFDYIYQYPISTSIIFQNLSGTQTSYLDQSAEWASNNKLNFTIGTMKVGDTWQGTFRLKVKKSGSIDIFGENSALLFNNSGTMETLTLPRTFLTVTPELPFSFDLQQINVIGFCAVADMNKAILPVSWITTYSGPATDIHEVVNYIDETGAHIPFHTASYHVMGDNTATRMTTFDLNSVPKGKHYDIEVRAYTSNAEDTAIACGGTSYDTSGKTFIKLE